MAHAEKCPICGGNGRLNSSGKDTSTCPQLQTCHGCNGKGWIEVVDHNIPVWPALPPLPCDPYKPYYPWITYYVLESR